MHEMEYPCLEKVRKDRLRSVFFVSLGRETRGQFGENGEPLVERFFRIIYYSKQTISQECPIENFSSVFHSEKSKNGQPSKLTIVSLDF